MKQPPAIFSVIAMLLFLPGCHNTPKYLGEGRIINTTSWEDNIARVPGYTLELASFPLSTNCQQKFSLGKISFFRRTTITVFLRFTSNEPWAKHTRFTPSEQFRRGYEISKINDIDMLQARWICSVDAENGKQIIRFDKLLKDCIWSQSHIKGSSQINDIYDLASHSKEVPASGELTLSFSFWGDPALTNRAELVVVCGKWGH
jgi:hypothetical protein